MSRGKRVKKANRRIWAGFLQGLIADGYLQREEVFVFEPFRPAHVTTPNPLAWETPKEQKRPSGEPCEKCKRCAHCGDHHDAAEKPRVVISTKLWAKINALMDHFDKHEWLGVLTAGANGVFVDMEVPKQEVTGGTVQQVDHAIVPLTFKVDGVIHSHVSMGAFHSGVDDEHLVSNYPVSIVVSKKDRLEFEAIRTVTQECGGIHRYKTGVTVELESQAAWLEGVVSRVTVAIPFVREVTPNYTTTGTKEPWMHGKPYCPMGQCYRERDHLGEHMDKAAMKADWERTHPNGVIVAQRSTAVLCQRNNWCFRDAGHAQACSAVREEDMCIAAGYCVQPNGHTGVCSGHSYRHPGSAGIGYGSNAWWQGKHGH